MTVPQIHYLTADDYKALVWVNLNIFLFLKSIHSRKGRYKRTPTCIERMNWECLFGKSSSRMIHPAGSPLNANINTIIYACALFYCNKILMNLLVLEKFDRNYNGDHLYNDIVSTEWPVAKLLCVEIHSRSRQIQGVMSSSCQSPF